MSNISYEQLEKSLDIAISGYIKQGLIRLADRLRADDKGRLEQDQLQSQHQRQAALMTLLTQHPGRMRQQFLKWGISFEEVHHLAEQKALFSQKQASVFSKIIDLLSALHTDQREGASMEKNGIIVMQQRKTAKETKFVNQRKNWHPL